MSIAKKPQPVTIRTWKGRYPEAKVLFEQRDAPNGPSYYIEYEGWEEIRDGWRVGDQCTVRDNLLLGGDQPVVFVPINAWQRDEIR